MAAPARTGSTRKFRAVVVGILLGLISAVPAHGQSSDILAVGDAAVTSYSETPDGAVLRIIGLDGIGGDFSGQTVDADTGFSLKASEIGQVFGLAFDDATPPNIYATATSAHGLRVEGEGKEAQWASDQFGTQKGGGPGSIWKIDGTTGEVSLFANVELDGAANTGPALGNIAFDPVSQQLFVSDRGTGMIHRFDLDGNDMGHFDHGVSARPTTGLAALEFDPTNRLDITSEGFDPKDPDTWSYAERGRSVWGLAVNGGRLYYAVEEGPQIWSVRIGPQGDFGDDARLELDLPADVSSNPVADIAFTADRKMVLAQRGGAFVDADGPQHHRRGDNAVIVYSPELPDDPDTPSMWSPNPDFAPVGKTAPYRNAAGGVSLGHGYDDDGTLSRAACMATLWTTGDALSEDDGNTIDGIEGQEATSFSSESGDNIYVKVIAAPDSEKRAGLMGDVEIFTDCAGEPLDELAAYDAPTCPGDDPRCPAPYEPPVIGPGPEEPPVYKGPDLALVKIAQGERCNKGQPCSFEVLVRNVGSEPYYGPITFEDTNDNNDPLQSYGPTPPWMCAAGDFIAAFCRHEDTYLAPGDGVSVNLTFTIPDDWAEPTYRNCASLSWAPWQGYGDANPNNDRACDYAPVCQPGTPGCGPDLLIEQVSSGRCEFEGSCRITTRITNVGGEDYTGPLSFNVADYTPGLVLQNYDSADEWSCGATGAENYQCYSGPVTLGPGDSREVTVSLGKPSEDEGDSARQCVALRLAPGISDENTYNNYACADLQLCREGSDCPADLAAEFRAECVVSDGSPTCHFLTYVRNQGAKPFAPRSISIVNDFGAGVTFEDVPTDYDSCESSGAGSGTGKCTSIQLDDAPDISLLPGRSVRFRYKYDVSGLTEKVRPNCVNIDWGEGQSDPNPSNDEFCAPVRICAAQGDGCPVDLAVYVYRTIRCYRGRECVVVSPLATNIGDAPFVGSFTAVISTIPNLEPSGLLLELDGQAIGQCSIAETGEIACDSGQITVPNADPAYARVYNEATYAVPEDFALDSTELCLELTDITGDDADRDNNRACTRVIFNDPPQAMAAGVEASADLAVTKRLLGACAKAGDECRYRVRVSNDGSVPIKSEIVIDDVLSPASGTFVSASAPGWTAEANGDGKAVLTLAVASLEPGQSKAVDVSFKMNADASGNVENCATARKLPGDGNDSNDKACVTVTLDEEDTTEPPPPPPPAQGELDLSLQLSGDNSCSTGQTCRAQVTLTNVGSESFAGPLSVAHSFTGGRSAQVRYSGGGLGFACGPAIDNAQCSNTSLSLAPGAATTYPINFSPTRAASGTYQNCAEVQWTRGGGAEIVMAQSKLNQLGYNAGTADGKAGPQTRRALRDYQKDNGLAQTGQLDEATSLKLLGPAKSFEDVNAGNDRACLSTTIATTCTGGRFWNGSACVCPSGENFERGQCRKPPVVKPCPYKGQFRGRDGNCHCPSGQEVVGGVCKKPVEACPYKGQFRGRDGNCYCPSGQDVIGGVCKKPVEACPYKGQFRGRDGNCYCPSGQDVIGGVCKKPVMACTADKILVNGKCVCPKGMTLQNGLCQPPPVKACPYKGQYRDRSGNCVCPTGMTLHHGQCSGGPTVCPRQVCPYRGQSRGSDCKCRCPSGQQVIGGVCTTPDIKKKIPCNDLLRKMGAC